MSEPVLGIDFGTENVRAMLYLRNGNTKAIEDENGKHVWPSMIGFNENGLRLFGNLAKTDSSVSEENSIRSPRKLFDKSPIREFGDNLEAGIGHLPINEKMPADVYPETYLAMVLKNIKEAAEAQNGPVKKVMIAIPSSYAYNQRHSMAAAGLAAGFEQVETISSASAVAVAFSQKHNIVDGTKVVLAIDIGADAMSLSLFRLSSGTVQIVGRQSICDLPFCGSNVSRLVADMIRERCPINTSEKLIASEASEMKKKLSAAERARTSGNLQKENFVIERSDFDKKLSPFLETLNETIVQFFAEFRNDPKTVDEIILLGGGSRVPAIRARILEIFHEATQRQTLNADEAVAQGAAFYAAKRFFPNRICLNFYDIATSDVELELRGEQRVSIMQRGAPIYDPSKFEIRDYVGLSNGESTRTLSNVWEIRDGRKIEIGSVATLPGTIQVSLYANGEISLENGNILARFDVMFFFGEAIKKIMGTLLVFDEMDSEASNAENLKNTLAEKVLQCQKALDSEKRVELCYHLKDATENANHWLEANSANRIQGKEVSRQIEQLQEAYNAYRQKKSKYEADISAVLSLFGNDVERKQQHLEKCKFPHLHQFGNAAMQKALEFLESVTDSSTLDDINNAHKLFQKEWNKFYDDLCRCTQEHEKLEKECCDLEKLLELGPYSEQLDTATQNARSLVGSDTGADAISEARTELEEITRQQKENVEGQRKELKKLMSALMTKAGSFLKSKDYEPSSYDLRKTLKECQKLLESKSEHPWKLLADARDRIQKDFDSYSEHLKTESAQKLSELERLVAEVQKELSKWRPDEGHPWTAKFGELLSHLSYVKEYSFKLTNEDIDSRAKEINALMQEYRKQYEDHAKDHKNQSASIKDARIRLEDAIKKANELVASSDAASIERGNIDRCVIEAESLLGSKVARGIDIDKKIDELKVLEKRILSENRKAEGNQSLEDSGSGEKSANASVTPDDSILSESPTSSSVARENDSIPMTTQGQDRPLPRGISFDLRYEAGGKVETIFKRNDAFGGKFESCDLKYEGGSGIFLMERDDSRTRRYRLNIPEIDDNKKSYHIKLIVQTSTTGTLYVDVLAKGNGVKDMLGKLFTKTEYPLAVHDVLDRHESGRYIKSSST